MSAAATWLLAGVTVGIGLTIVVAVIVSIFTRP